MILPFENATLLFEWAGMGSLFVRLNVQTLLLPSFWTSPIFAPEREGDESHRLTSRIAAAENSEAAKIAPTSEEEKRIR